MTYKEHNQTVHKLIHETRDARQMSLRDFASALGVSHNAVDQWERGVAEPREILVSGWQDSDETWIRHLALAILGARVRRMVEGAPAPDTSAA